MAINPRWHYATLDNKSSYVFDQKGHPLFQSVCYAGKKKRTEYGHLAAASPHLRDAGYIALELIHANGLECEELVKALEKCKPPK